MIFFTAAGCAYAEPKHKLATAKVAKKSFFIIYIFFIYFVSVAANINILFILVKVFCNIFLFLLWLYHFSNIFANGLHINIIILYIWLIKKLDAEIS
jgi:uncharacterized protein YqhQ